MIKIVLGFLLGVVVATVGFSGMAHLFDRGVNSIKNVTKELAQ